MLGFGSGTGRGVDAAAVIRARAPQRTGVASALTQTSAQPPGSVELFRLPVDKPETAVQFLYQCGGGVMDLIAHFWERLGQTPPLQREALHLVVAAPAEVVKTSICLDVTKSIPQNAGLQGAMLYVPKAHRADVLALNPLCAAEFARYIAVAGAPLRPAPVEWPVEVGVAVEDGAIADPTIRPQIDPPASSNGGRVAIDFLTGATEGLMAMIPHLLPLVHKKTPARQMVNTVLQLPADAPADRSGHVRTARDADVPVLNRWRKLYKDERGILFDADFDSWVTAQKVFVLESEQQIVAIAKFDLELNRLVEIGGVYTFPEFRKRGFGRELVCDLAGRVRSMGKIPTLQVDRQNLPAATMYERLGWKSVGELARVWLTG